MKKQSIACSNCFELTTDYNSIGLCKDCQSLSKRETIKSTKHNSQLNKCKVCKKIIKKGKDRCNVCVKEGRK